MVLIELPANAVAKASNCLRAREHASVSVFAESLPPRVIHAATPSNVQTFLATLIARAFREQQFATAFDARLMHFGWPRAHGANRDHFRLIVREALLPRTDM